MLDILQTLLDMASSRPIEALILFLAPFAREDVAIVVGGLLIVEQRLPFGLALASLYAGIVASDFLLFGLGRLARRNNRLRRLLLHPRVERANAWLLGHVPAAMIVARIVPGVIFPVYVGCGLLGVRTAVFALITMATAAIYLPALLWVVVRFGDDVLSGAGYWAWVLTLTILVILITNWARNPPWGLMLRVGRFGFAGVFRQAGKALKGVGKSHAGMPSLGALSSRIGLAERIPPKLFYVPMAFQWLWLSARYRSLSLPTLVNPLIEVGGLWGESKQVYLDMVSGEARQWIAPYVMMARGSADGAADGRRAAALARENGLTFPLVAKPDIGWQGYGVRSLATEAELLDYVAAFPEGATLMLQQLAPWEGEAGVFYVRRPDQERGEVVALTLRYFPHVIGDGVQTVRDLILADQRASWKAGLHFGLQNKHAGLTQQMLNRIPGAGEIVRLSFIGSIRVGGLYRDAGAQITPALSERFDAISRSMPEFHYGRYDIRFASMERLQEGEDFLIIEINGAGSESISAWDPKTPLLEVYRRLLAHQRMLFEIGAMNRQRGWKTPGPLAILRAARRQTGLIGRYPPSS
ncbi:MAG: VTT domain-containing protein [Pseudomonadota bacterium]|nr:VTT domain-containing protein [Pseudomonadota bacterium]